uniref:RING-type domain-containing protein n=1 Tax=Xiphophorus maculatus TaxID=8083 RepID=A0A3B5QGJ9_XIPMA
MKNVGEEEQLSCCALCQKVLMDPVSTSCGHWFCRQCIRSSAGLLAANQSSCSPGETEHLQSELPSVDSV